MKKQQALTGESFRNRFESQFDLVNYAISLAQDMIVSGRGPRVKTDVLNVAHQILDEITAGKDVILEEERGESGDDIDPLLIEQMSESMALG